jgi:hypothetical protein
MPADARTNTKKGDNMSELLTEQGTPKRTLIERPRFVYLYMISLLLFILVSGYILIYSGSLFIEGIVKGWYKELANPSDNYALWIAYLTAFPCLLGVVGGILVLATRSERYHKIKILLFVPSVVWTFLQIIQILLNFQYWFQMVYLFPMLSLCVFILFCVVKQVRIPLLAVKPSGKKMEQTVTNDIKE